VQLTVGLALGELLERESNEAVDESLQANPYAATELAQLRHVVGILINRLPEREGDLIRQHYHRQRDFQAIARDLHLSKGRISQLHAQALARIRKALTEPIELDRAL